ncbi:MAG: hypothetical protein FWH14_06295 [Oscillospiraceae bacterium]|nr:hypothetical protein [Oscillospiraceae bacterium]
MHATVEKSSRENFVGLFKGKINMSDDFNDPIDDMREYMDSSAKKELEVASTTSMGFWDNDIDDEVWNNA